MHLPSDQTSYASGEDGGGLGPVSGLHQVPGGVGLRSWHPAGNLTFAAHNRRLRGAYRIPWRTMA
jgi:hypothetical protein